MLSISSSYPTFSRASLYVPKFLAPGLQRGIKLHERVLERGMLVDYKHRLLRPLTALEKFLIGPALVGELRIRSRPALHASIGAAMTVVQPGAHRISLKIGCEQELGVTVS
jgi:hypothetical protein